MVVTSLGSDVKLLATVVSFMLILKVLQKNPYRDVAVPSAVVYPPFHLLILWMSGPDAQFAPHAFTQTHSFSVGDTFVSYYSCILYEY